MTTISHYGSGSSPTWTSEGTEKWTRDIPGIDGGMDAIQEAGKSPILQLHDLAGNIVGTVEDSETLTKLASTYNSTEFGVPTTSNPPKYSWLGADGLGSELTVSGVSTEGGSSYVPEIGRTLQTGPIASPGSFPNGTGGVGVTGGPGPGASVNQIMEIFRQNEAARGAAEAKEAWEKEPPCLKYNEVCPGPGSGGEVSEAGSDPEFGENTHGCSVWASWGGLASGTSNDFAVYGHFNCTYSSYTFELGVELQLINSGGVEGGTYQLARIAHWDFGKSESQGEHAEHAVFECTPYKWYRLVVWGRYWYSNGYSPWNAYSVDGRSKQCSAELAPAEYPLQ